MKQNERNSRKRLNSLILLVAFTAVMLIVSTYAWFSTQKNVTISSITGHVQVAEGLQISLDAKTWSSSIDLSKFTPDANGVLKSNEFLTDNDAADGHEPSLQKPYILKTETTQGENGKNVVTYIPAENIFPEDLKPMSTTGGTNEGIGKDRLQMYWGENTHDAALEDITLMNGTSEDKYIAFDVFLQNSSGSGMVYDTLLLEPNSSITVPESKVTTGLQNAVRVAFALYENNADKAGASEAEKKYITVADTPTTKEIILGAAKDKLIEDVAIWEPNADSHVENIVISNNNVKWTKEDLKLYRFDVDADAPGFADFVMSPAYDDVDKTVVTEGKVAQFHTYALTAKSVETYHVTDPKGEGTADDAKVGPGYIDNVYNWADNLSGTYDTGLRKQITLQTRASDHEDLTKNDGMASETKLELISIAKTEKINDPTVAEGDKPTNNAFQIEAGQYHKMRIYVWLEGQDVDCTNFASLGGQVTIDLGFSKYGSEDEKYPS